MATPDDVHDPRAEARRRRWLPVAVAIVAGIVGGFSAVRLSRRARRRPTPPEHADGGPRLESTVDDGADVSGTLKNAAFDLALTLTDAARQARAKTPR